MPDTRTACATCQQPIAFIDCPTGGWWQHDEHPADEHDAFPPNGGHTESCAYVGGISSRCTCSCPTCGPVCLNRTHDRVYRELGY